jgi:hypothetical protein
MWIRMSNKPNVKAAVVRLYMKDGRAQQQRDDRVLQAVKHRDHEARLFGRVHRPTPLRVSQMRRGRTVDKWTVHRLPVK